MHKQSTEGKSCCSSDCQNCCKCQKFFRLIVVVLLLLNTIFIGSMWFKALSLCPAMKGGKMCPISGQPLTEK